jgi:hypothetical protein
MSIGDIGIWFAAGRDFLDLAIPIDLDRRSKGNKIPKAALL